MRTQGSVPGMADTSGVTWGHETDPFVTQFKAGFEFQNEKYPPSDQLSLCIDLAFPVRLLVIIFSLCSSGVRVFVCAYLSDPRFSLCFFCWLFSFPSDRPQLRLTITHTQHDTHIHINTHYTYTDKARRGELEKQFRNE